MLHATMAWLGPLDTGLCAREETIFNIMAIIVKNYTINTQPVLYTCTLLVHDASWMQHEHKQEHYVIKIMIRTRSRTDQDHDYGMVVTTQTSRIPFLNYPQNYHNLPTMC